VRQIRMLRAMWRELETGLRRLPHGHGRGNPETAKESPTDYRASSRPYQVIWSSSSGAKTRPIGYAASR
jgi:hypothetical protein